MRRETLITHVGVSDDTQGFLVCLNEIWSTQQPASDNRRVCFTAQKPLYHTKLQGAVMLLVKVEKTPVNLEYWVGFVA